MAKPNGLVKISGNLLENPKVLRRLKRELRTYSLIVLVGGGQSINEIFEEGGWEIKFCPLGWVFETLEQRQAARDELERNQALMQDLLDEKGIEARVEIPVRYVGNVLCHENGDVMILSAYNGFDKFFIFTLKSRVKAKQEWLKQIAKCFQHIAEGKLDKIEVVGF